MDVQRVVATEEAEQLMQSLKEKYGDLLFHQSGGCCEGSVPMCFEKKRFLRRKSRRLTRIFRRRYTVLYA